MLCSYWPWSQFLSRVWRSWLISWSASNSFLPTWQKIFLIFLWMTSLIKAEGDFVVRSDEIEFGCETHWNERKANCADICVVLRGIRVFLVRAAVRLRHTALIVSSLPQLLRTPSILYGGKNSCTSMWIEADWQDFAWFRPEIFPVGKRFLSDVTSAAVHRLRDGIQFNIHLGMFHPPRNASRLFFFICIFRMRRHLIPFCIDERDSPSNDKKKRISPESHLRHFSIPRFPLVLVGKSEKSIELHVINACNGVERVNEIVRKKVHWVPSSLKSLSPL